ncbi:MAG: uroporphyrinogen decarboxylase family protein [Anaerolineae bacterium]
MPASMTSRERLLAAIRHEEPDRVPVSPRLGAWLHDYYGCSCWLHELQAAREFDFDPLIILPSAITNYVTDRRATARDLPDVSLQLDVRDAGDRRQIRRTFQTPAGKLTDRTEEPKPGGAYGKAPDFRRMEPLVKERADLQRLRYLLPDPNAADLSHLRLIDAEVGDRGLTEVTVNSALDYQAADAVGPEELFIIYMADRPFFDELVRLFHEHVMAQTRAVLEAGAKVVFGTGFAISLSVGWSPKTYREVFKPLVKEHVDLVHSYEALYHFYDDGRMMQILPDLTEIGVDVVSTLTPPPVGDVDLAEAKRTVGDRLCLKGYTDLLYVVKMGTPELIRDTVRQAILTAAPGGGFILGSSDSFRDTGVANVRAYFQAARDFGDYSHLGHLGR